MEPPIAVARRWEATRLGACWVPAVPRGTSLVEVSGRLLPEPGPDHHPARLRAVHPRGALPSFTSYLLHLDHIRRSRFRALQLNEYQVHVSSPSVSYQLHDWQNNKAYLVYIILIVYHHGNKYMGGWRGIDLASQMC